MIAGPILIPIPIPAGHHPLPVWALVTLIVIGAIALAMGVAVVVIMVKDAIKSLPTPIPVEEMRRRVLSRCAICGHRHIGLCATDCMECPRCPSTHTVDGHKYRCVLRGSHRYSQHCSNADKVECTWPDAAADIDVSSLGEPPGSTTIPRVTDPSAEEEP